MKKFLFVAFALLSITAAFAQTPEVKYIYFNGISDSTVVPNREGIIYYNEQKDDFRFNRNGTWYYGFGGGAGGGVGTVTDFSAGNLSPLFTSNVATSTSTPALTFSLSTQTANRVFAGPTSGGVAAPTFRSLVLADIPDLSSVYVTPSFLSTWGGSTSITNLGTVTTGSTGVGFNINFTNSTEVGVLGIANGGTGSSVARTDNIRYSYPPVIFTANHTVAFSDTTKVIVMNTTSGDLELHVPQDATTDFTHGQLITVKLIGGNDLTIVGDGSAVVTSTSGSLVVSGSANTQWITLFKHNTNTWDAIVPAPAASVSDGAADGATKGILALNATYFDATAGIATIDLTNGAASGSQGGYLTTGAQTIAGAKTFSSTIVGSINGNAATVTTNANLTGPVTSSGNTTSFGTFSSATLAGGLSDEAGTSGGFVRADYVQGTQDLFISASGMWERTTGGCAPLAKTEVGTSLFNYQSLAFDQSTDEFAQFQTVPPRKWDNGTVTVVFYWTGASGSGDVVWGIQFATYANDDAFSIAFGTAQTVTDTYIAANDLHITTVTSAITPGNTPADGDMLVGQVYRDADAGADTYSADAKLLGFSIRFTTDAAKDN